LGSAGWQSRIRWAAGPLYFIVEGGKMQQLLDILSAAEAAGDLTEALCHSTHAAIEALGDAADEYLLCRCRRTVHCALSVR
jgi:hypothetical protein